MGLRIMFLLLYMIVRLRKATNETHGTLDSMANTNHSFWYIWHDFDSYLDAVMKWINRILNALEGANMSYSMLSKSNLMIEQEILREKLSFHSHSDRQEARETTRQQAVQWELKQIDAEWDRRATASKDVHAGLEIVRKRWIK